MTAPLNKLVSQRRQGGLALVVALIVLVAMSMAGIAMIRSVDTAAIIAGNLAFRQGASLAGDAGVESARSWLLAHTSLLQADQPSSGYYATSQNALDLTGNRTPGDTSDDAAWTGAGIAQVKCLAMDAAGNTACYIIHRLCDAAGPLDSATCATQTAEATGDSRGALRAMKAYQKTGFDDVASMGYYRVTVRVAGPRNNVSFIQAFVVI